MKAINIGEQGRLRFINFVKTISAIVRNEKIDHVVAGGNSGISLSEITLMIFELLENKTPTILRVPFYRYYPQHRDDENYKFDPSYYKAQVNDYVKDTKKGGIFLFVDDEIGKGNTALGIKKLLQECLLGNRIGKMDKYYIVAEDQGFSIPKNMPEIDLRSIAKEIVGYNNLIFTFVPYKFEKPIEDYFGGDDELAFHIRTNLLLNLPVKDFNDGSPIYSNKLLTEARVNIKDFKLLQNSFRNYVREEISKILF